MTTMDCLPYEVLAHIFQYLGVSDLLVASSVSHVWREAASYLLAKRVTVMITDDATPAIETFLASSIAYQNWVFKELDVKIESSFADFWNKVAQHLKILMLWNVDCSERTFIHLLNACSQIEELRLYGLAHLLMPGTLLSNPEDIKLLSSSLCHVTRLHLACSRYLTDSIFSRITSIVGSLNKLSIAGCQISFHSAIYKRFYPADGRVETSDHVLTFDHILKYIEKNAKTLKEISFGRTSIDSESLSKLAKVKDLQLESVHLMSCDQLSKSGIQLLCENQKYITDLDVSLCSRLTDYVVLSVTEHLPNIKKLNLRRCQGITENGVRALRKAKQLEELNLSHLEAVTSESIQEALGKEPRPNLKWLGLASLNLDWRAIESVAQMAPNIEHLDVSMCIAAINDRSVQAICRSLPRLQVFYLNGCTAITDIGLAGHGLGRNEPVHDAVNMGLSLENLGVKQKALRELNLCGCNKITDITLTYALKLQELQYLNLSHCQAIAQPGLEAMVRHCPSLEVLMLADCGQVTDHVVLLIAHYLRRIKTLDIQRCVQLTDDALDSLSKCYTLRYLDVSGCDKLSLEAVRHVQNRIPLLRNFHYRGIKEKDPLQESGLTNILKSIPPPPPLLQKFMKKI